MMLMGLFLVASLLFLLKLTNHLLVDSIFVKLTNVSWMVKSFSMLPWIKLANGIRENYCAPKLSFKLHRDSSRELLRHILSFLPFFKYKVKAFVLGRSFIRSWMIHHHHHQNTNFLQSSIHLLMLACKRMQMPSQQLSREQEGISQ